MGEAEQAGSRVAPSRQGIPGVPQGGRCSRSLWQILVILVAAACLAALVLEGAGIVPVVRFTRERIEIRVRPEAFEVDGTYVYSNPLPIPWTRGLRVPFHVDGDQRAPATVAVTEVRADGGVDRRGIPVRWLGGEPRFTVGVPASGSTTVRVRFVQTAPYGTGTYLLTTTRPWGRPLDRADYLLRTDGVRITGSNYPLDGPDGLSFSREEFMPERDWTFTWEAEETRCKEP